MNAPLAIVPPSTLANYEAMVRAIAQCERVDEVKDIRDKAIALEAYYRQARNLEAERQAANVRLRAERQAGALLKELARAETPNPSGLGGKAGKTVVSAPVTQQSPYAAALLDTGISRQTAHRFQALANVPQKVFDKALSEPDRPSAAKVLARAKIDEAASPQPKVSDEALWLWGRLRDFERMGYLTISPATLFQTMTDAMRADVLRLAPMVGEALSAIGEFR